jgi:hypothetical protein
MEDILVLQKPARISDRKVRTNVQRPKVSTETRKSNLNSEKLVAEVDENFKRYLSCNGLANEDNLLFLSSKLHYYYDYEELKEVTTLINLKKLNLVKHLDDFLKSIYNGLSPKSNFVGCFSDTNSGKGEGLPYRLYKKFLNFLDAKIDMDIDSRNLSRLLESHGFKVIDMREIDGLTYFRTQNYR